MKRLVSGLTRRANSRLQQANRISPRATWRAGRASRHTVTRRHLSRPRRLRGGALACAIERYAPDALVFARAARLAGSERCRRR